MRKSRFSEEQIIAILKESEAGVETGEPGAPGSPFFWANLGSVRYDLPDPG